MQGHTDGSLHERMILDKGHDSSPSALGIFMASARPDSAPGSRPCDLTR